MSSTDRELMESFGAGNDDAFRALVRRHQRGLKNFFWRRCFDKSLAEDCVQEVFLRMVRHRGRWRPDAKVTTYMYRIAHNLWIDKYRSRKAAPPMTSLHAAKSEEGPSILDAVSGRQPDPAKRAGDIELGARIARALEKLTEDQRTVFVLAETKGLKYRDIGELLGIPVGTVKSRMHAAVTKLRVLLKEEARDTLR